MALLRPMSWWGLMPEPPKYALLLDQSDDNAPGMLAFAALSSVDDLEIEIIHERLPEGALLFLEQHRPKVGVVVIKVESIDYSAYKLARTIQKSGARNVPVVFVGPDSVHARTQAREAGGIGYLVSPIDGADLTELLDEAILRRNESAQYRMMDFLLPASEVDRSLAALNPSPADASISVSIYLDTNDPSVIARTERAVSDLIDFLGYEEGGPSETKDGSFIRRFRARLKKSLTADEITERLTKIERAVEVRYLDLPQAEYDGKAAKVITDLTATIKDIPNACIRAGSTLLIKYEQDGKAILLARQLSQLEIRALEKYPEIQNNPSTVIESLGMAIQALSTPSVGSGAESAPD